MRLANVAGRMKLLVPGGAVDLERASGGEFSSNPLAAWERFDELVRFATTGHEADESFDPSSADAPVPYPRQVFAIALNYSEHADESGFAKPDAPLVFAKFPTAIVGPVSTVELPVGSVDWEVEAVVVMGRTATRVSEAAAWDYVGGVTVGQDISERVLQRSGPAPQFCLAKSFPGFAPIGPCVVSADELGQRDDLVLGCDLNGVEMQKGNTRDMLFSVPELVAYLSGILTLLPGDLIFTGTPPGVGMGRTPPVFLQVGDVLHSSIEGIGSITQTFVSTRTKED
jgi:2,4-didehydro-3-deoxy-L-rhamnonate hydrolase